MQGKLLLNDFVLLSGQETFWQIINALNGADESSVEGDKQQETGRDWPPVNKSVRDVRWSMAEVRRFKVEKPNINLSNISKRYFLIVFYILYHSF